MYALLIFLLLYQCIKCWFGGFIERDTRFIILHRALAAIGGPSAMTYQGSPAHTHGRWQTPHQVEPSPRENVVRSSRNSAPMPGERSPKDAHPLGQRHICVGHSVAQSPLVRLGESPPDLPDKMYNYLQEPRKTPSLKDAHGVLALHSVHGSSQKQNTIHLCPPSSA